MSSGAFAPLDHSLPAASGTSRASSEQPSCSDSDSSMRESLACGSTPLLVLKEGVTVTHVESVSLAMHSTVSSKSGINHHATAAVPPAIGTALCSRVAAAFAVFVPVLAATHDLDTDQGTYDGMSGPSAAVASLAVLSGVCGSAAVVGRYVEAGGGAIA